jgi:hypothetical protein
MLAYRRFYALQWSRFEGDRIRANAIGLEHDNLLPVIVVTDSKMASPGGKREI